MIAKDDGLIRKPGETDAQFRERIFTNRRKERLDEKNKSFGVRYGSPVFPFRLPGEVATHEEIAALENLIKHAGPHAPYAETVRKLIAEVRRVRASSVLENLLRQIV